MEELEALRKENAELKRQLEERRKLNINTILSDKFNHCQKVDSDSLKEVPECCSREAKYEYLKKMSAIAISALKEKFFMLSNNEFDTFLRLFATELKFKWNIKN